MSLLTITLSLLAGCAEKSPSDTAATASADDTGGADDDTGPDEADPFADAVVSYSPGETAGFGQDGYPDIVLGPPEGGGDAGGVDVLSLGQEGEIVLSFDDIEIVDGEGPDLLVFENPFTGWYETGVVAVSEDGVSWSEFPCAPDDAEGLYPGCAGVGLVWANSENGLDPTDPEVAGGDAVAVVNGQPIEGAR